MQTGNECSVGLSYSEFAANPCCRQTVQMIDADPLEIEYKYGGFTDVKSVKNVKDHFKNSDEINCPGTITIVDAKNEEYSGN